MENSSRSIIVARYISPWDAYLACGRLNAEGVHAWIAYDQHVWADWRFSTALGGVRIVTTIARAAEAKIVLAAHDCGEYESCLSGDDLEAAALRCPICNSTDIQTKRFGSLVPLLLFLFLFAVIFPVRRDRHHCRNCGRNWRY
ncbi:MAG TPA: hypothetical protein VJ727_01945 [Rhodanobacteraceae bacterium]|nr:hypothetical protein [Rhodanobacteraceae bacterium]